MWGLIICRLVPFLGCLSHQFFWVILTVFPNFQGSFGGAGMIPRHGGISDLQSLLVLWEGLFCVWPRFCLGFGGLKVSGGVLLPLDPVLINSKNPRIAAQPGGNKHCSVPSALGLKPGWILPFFSPKFALRMSPCSLLCCSPWPFQ